MIINYLILIAGVALVIVGANGLVDGASSIAKRFNISNLVIGLTVVAFGTSTPELAVSVLSTLKGSTDIAIGNVIGSNILNIFLILGIAAVIFPLTVHSSTIWKEIPLSLLAVIMVIVTANEVIFDGSGSAAITRSDGIILLSFFLIFIYYSFGVAKNTQDSIHNEVKKMPVLKSVIYVVLGLTGLYFGGQFIVESAIKIARSFEISEAIIGLTIVAVGTSLPELATSIVAAIKKNSDIAVGNVVGSNIFNVFFILGVSGLIRPLPLGNITIVDLLVALFASLLLFLFCFTFKGRKINRVEGLIFLVIYAVYTYYLIKAS